MIGELNQVRSESVVFSKAKLHFWTWAFSGKEDTQYRETLVLDSRLRGNDGVSSFLEIPLDKVYR